MKNLNDKREKRKFEENKAAILFQKIWKGYIIRLYINKLKIKQQIKKEIYKAFKKVFIIYIIII